MTKKIDIGGELHSVATDHKVADASEIKDISKENKSQAAFNNDVDRHEVEIHGPGGIESRLTDVEQLEQIVLDGGEAQIATGSDFINPDSTKRAKIPTVGAILDGLNDGVYDVSKRNPASGPNSDGKFTLKYILANADTLIPTSFRHAGMIISFAQSSDNKYVQYRLMANSFSTTVTDWQGVDTEPTAGSDNLVKSGGVYEQIPKLLPLQGVMDANGGGYNKIEISGNTITISKSGFSIFVNNKRYNFVGTNDYTVSLGNGTRDYLLLDRTKLVDSEMNWNSINDLFVHNHDISVNTNYYILAVSCVAELLPIGLFANVIQEQQQIFKYNEAICNRFSPVLRNGTHANTINANAVTSKYVYDFGDFDRAYIITDRPNSQGCEYRYGCAQYFGYGGHSENNIKVAAPYSFDATNNYVDRAEYQGQLCSGFVIDILEFNTSTQQVSPLRVKDFANYHLFYKLVKTSSLEKNMIDSLYRGLGMKYVNSIAIEDATEFQRGSVQPNGYVSSSEALVSPWYLVRSGNGLKFSYPSTVQYGGISYDVRFRVVVNGENKQSGGTPHEMLQNHTEVLTNTLVVPAAGYKYMKFSVYLYSGGSIVSDETMESVFGNITIPLSISIGKGVASGLYNIEEMSEQLNEVAEDVDEIKQEFVSTDIVALNNKKTTLEKFIQLSRTIKGGSVLNIRKNLVLAHFSDVHLAFDNVGRITEYCRYYSDYVDDILFTGDVASTSFNEISDATYQAYWHAKGADNVLFCIGNHDTAKYENDVFDWTYYVGKPAYDRYLSPYISQWGVVQPSGVGDDNYYPCYYYKDYSDEKVRLIVIDVMGWDNTQLNWLVAVLGATSSDMNVIIASHYPAAMVAEKCTFTSLFSFAFVSDVIPTDALDAVDTFINDYGGHFICWITGHQHRDFIGVVDGHSNQPIIVISTASTDRGQTQYDNVERVVGTKSQDLFNIVSIDTYNGMISMFRVGANKDMMLRHIGSICYDYKQKKLVWNN